jgi:hypothetical protein
MSIYEMNIAPDAYSKGKIDDLWIDKSTGDVYKCVGISVPSGTSLGYITVYNNTLDTTYTWEKINGGGSNMIEYYTGELEYLEGTMQFLLKDLNHRDFLNNYYEIEFLIKLNGTSDKNPIAKFTFYHNNDGMGQMVEHTLGVEDVKFSIGEYGDGCTNIMLSSASTTPIDNPSMIYIRLYRKA